MGTTQISPANFDGFGGLVLGDKDLWGEPFFSVKVSLVNQKDEATNVLWIAVQVEATWREQNPDYTTYKIFETPRVQELPPGLQLGELGEQYIVDTPERQINGTNEGLVNVYDGDAEGNLLVKTIQADGDKKGRLDNPHLVVSFRPGVTVPLVPIPG